MSTDTCPRCGAPVTFHQGDRDWITVYFECPEPSCPSGKLSDADRAVIASFDQ